MSKVRNFAELAPNVGFSEFDFYDLYRSTFEKSELGRVKKLLPLHAMAENFGLVSKSMRPKLGRKSYFTPEGKVALMFLKMYTGMSCPKLMEQLNGNIHYQMFCDVIIDPTRPLTNYKLLDDIMLELAGKLKIQQLQDILAEQWKPYMQNLDTMYTDATCYESEMRYPTDPKLLWEGIEKSYETMCELSKRLRIHRPRTKFIDVQKANLAFRKQRKHSKSQTRKMTRRLLELLGKILKEIRKTERAYENAQSLLTAREKSDLEIITKMYRQQKNHFQSKDCRDSIPNRIVSISKPYVRPIVRGKEVKSVEFGAKVNNILVDGISFIEKLSFNAFNEGTRLIHCLKMHKRLFRVEAKKSGRGSRLCRNQQQGLLQGERDTDIVREARKAVQLGKERERPCQTGTCQSEGDSDGGLVRHTEKALRPEADQGPDEADGNPVHLLRHPHGKRGAAGGQDRAESTTGGCLKQKYAHRKVLSRGNYASAIENGQIVRPKRPERDMKTEI